MPAAPFVTQRSLIMAGERARERERAGGVCRSARRWAEVSAVAHKQSGALITQLESQKWYVGKENSFNSDPVLKERDDGWHNFCNNGRVIPGRVLETSTALCWYIDNSLSNPEPQKNKKHTHTTTWRSCKIASMETSSMSQTSGSKLPVSHDAQQLIIS